MLAWQLQMVQAVVWNTIWAMQNRKPSRAGKNIHGGWITLLLASLICASAIAAPTTVRIGIGEYPPFKVQAERHGGLLTKMVVDVFKSRGIDTAIEWVPNNRAISLVMNGQYDGSFGWAHTPERDNALLFSKKPIHTYRMVFVERADAPREWSTLADLANLRIGVTMGNHYSQAFADLQAQGAFVVDEAAGDLNNLKKLAYGRLDLFPIEETVAQYLIATSLTPQEQVQLRIQKKPFWTTPIFFVISKKIPNAHTLMDEFDRGYDEWLRTKRTEELTKSPKP